MNLAPLAGEILTGMQEQLDARNLKTAVSGRCIVYAKQEMMMQAIRNLLNNVIKYTPEGSCITVTGEKHTLNIVSDIAEEQIENLQRLCEAFVKGDDADRKRRSADPTIAAVQQIAAQNHIKLRIDSRKQQLHIQLKQNTLRSPVCFRKIK